MKKIIYLLLFVVQVFNAQNTVEGFISPNIDTDWIILYKIEGTQQVFIQNSTIKKGYIEINGKQKEVGTFTLTLPKDAKPGAYRATYRLEGQGFIDFFYNKENVSFIFNPEYPTQSVAFTQSSENKLYKEYIRAISKVQQELDSIQILALQQPELSLAKEYKEAYALVNKTQNEYLTKSKYFYINPLIKGSMRSNPSEIITSVSDYMDNIINTFFDNIDFGNKTLVNSSFITNRVLDYIFYIHYSEDPEEQQKLHQKAVDRVLSKIKDLSYKRDMIQFIIDQFDSSKNIAMIDYLFDQHYNKLPLNLQNQKYKSEKIAKFVAEVGRIAPDFSWTEKGKNLKLSTLNDAEYYVLVFWSTTCSHCLREIPQLHSYMKNNKSTKVIGFALENDAMAWEQFSKNKLQGWYNVLGLNKWQNETARTYQINSTPTYIVLDKNKKIIAKPNELIDVQNYINQLKM